jgi:peroxiredoxin Q/BCP
MRRILIGLMLLLPLSAPAATLEVGDVAPDFLLEGTDGAVYRLSEHLGKRGVVLAWFPRAFTGG